jgi:hypothetical protein
MSEKKLIEKYKTFSLYEVKATYTGMSFIQIDQYDRKPDEVHLFPQSNDFSYQSDKENEKEEAIKNVKTYIDNLG